MMQTLPLCVVWVRRWARGWAGCRESSGLLGRRWLWGECAKEGSFYLNSRNI